MDKAFTIFSMVVLLLTSMTVAQYKLTGEVTGEARVTVACLVGISLPVSSVDFGTVSQGTVDDTTDDSPGPLEVKNDGTSLVDVTIARANSSTALFNGTNGGDNTTSFQFKARAPSTSFNASTSITSFTPVPGESPILFMKELRFLAGNNTADVDLRIEVPADESIGEKSELLDFIATLSPGFECGVDTGEPSSFVICHIPPGNEENPQTITIPAAALPAHLDHGDSLGACEDDEEDDEDDGE